MRLSTRQLAEIIGQNYGNMAHLRRAGKLPRGKALTLDTRTTYYYDSADVATWIQDRVRHAEDQVTAMMSRLKEVTHV